MNRILSALLLMIFPLRGGAQTTLSLFAAQYRDATAPFWGASLNALSDAGLGARVGAAFSPLRRPGDTSTTLDTRAWAADIDLMVSPRVPLLRPYLFAGVGLYSSRPPGGESTSMQHWSYGGGVTLSLVRGVSAHAEMRTRQPIVPRPSATATNYGKATELRAGLSFDFAGLTSPPSRERAPARDGGPSPRIPVPSVPVGGTVLPTASRYVGVPYKYGGTSPETGFDCSGFVQFVHARHSVPLPRTSRQMAEAGIRVENKVTALRPGDLMLFAEPGARISHVAMYAGENRIIHSSSSGGGVRYDDLTSSRGQWFATRMVAARRVYRDGDAALDLMRDLDTMLKAGLRELDPPDAAPRG